MKVLQLCHRIPFPPNDGGSIAMHQITTGLLKNNIGVKVMALDPTQLHSNPADISPDYKEQTGFEAVTIDTRVRIIPAFFNLFSNKSYNIERFRSALMSEKLDSVLQTNRFDIIQLEGLYLTPYLPVIRKHSAAPVLYRSHNIEHFIWLRLAQACNKPLKKRYLQLLARRLKDYETKVIHQVDGLVAISDIDRDYFHKLGYNKPSVVIPAGMPDIVLPDSLPEFEREGVFHLGSMDWRPNQEGVLWFLKKVWPLVTENHPELRFYLAGKRMPAHFYQFESDQVSVLGEVDDAIQFLLSKNIMVVPLLSGGGMRVKIIEGMAAAKVIVSTSIGAEGIDCEHKKNILLADDPQQMANWIIHCIENPDFAGNIGREARKLAVSAYSMDVIIKKLIAFYMGFYS